MSRRLVFVVTSIFASTVDAKQTGVAQTQQTVDVPLTFTTTITPFDASSGSGGASSKSLVYDSLNDGSSMSVDYSNSAVSDGWKQSGSSGSYMNNWLWAVLVGLLCCCCCTLIASTMCRKSKAKPKRSQPSARKESSKAAPKPQQKAEEELPLIAPLQPLFNPYESSQAGWGGAPMMAPMPMMQPIPTTSIPMTSYSVVSSTPVTGGSYVAAPYAAPTISYAAPPAAAYAAPTSVSTSFIGPASSSSYAAYPGTVV